jgi:hypothetical protein
LLERIWVGNALKMDLGLEGWDSYIEMYKTTKLYSPAMS